MKNEIFKKMRTMILLLGVTLFFSSFVSSDDDYIIINCPGNLAYDPVVDACVPEAENDGKGLVCVIKKIKTGEIKFACDPKGCLVDFRFQLDKKQHNSPYQRCS